MKVIGQSIIGLASLVGIVGLTAPGAYASDDANCVDGSSKSNLVVTWKSNSVVTVSTVHDKPVCADTALLFASYTMPDDYNGKPFGNNPTASPQHLFDSTSATLKKGESRAVTMEINLPEACKNTQVDLYYPPEITTPGPEGHGEQYIKGKILVKTEDACAPVTPEQPTPEQPTPEQSTPETPAATPTPVVPAELPQTGSGLADALMNGVLLSVVTYLAAYVVTRRR